MIDKEFGTYFTDLGYVVFWDFDKTSGETWWEILDTNSKMVCQIDAGIPISSIIEDCICLKENRDTTSSHDYNIYAPDTPEFDELLNKIYEKQN